MIKYEDNCVDCAVPGYPCIGSSCPNRRVPHYYCDECGFEDTLYYFDGGQYCLDCIKKNLEKVND